MKEYITGVGSRKASKPIMDTMSMLCNFLHDYTWRSGAADGMDTAVENGAYDTEIYLPWKGFNNSDSELYLENLSDYKVKQAREELKDVHPAYNNLSAQVKKFHIRNVFQVLGQDLLTPSVAVVCWTPDGANSFDTVTRETGGTGTAIKIASLYEIPVFNIKNEQDIENLIAFFNI